MDENSKTLVISLEKKSKKVVTEKPKKKRVVTETKKWINTVSINDLLENSQVANLEPILENDCGNSQELVAQQIRKKISGYLVQDREKGLYNPDKFVVFQDILNLFKTANMCCYYCKKGVLVYYEFVREPKQWTLERLDNSRGHNSDNIVLSCLRCNLRRRCMNSERYLKTKEMEIIVKLE